MTRLIDADALRDTLQYEIDKATPPFDDIVGAVRCGIRLSRNIAEDQPTVDAVPVKHGKWIHEVRYTIDSLHSYQQYRCSECGMTYITNTKYCPNCGARMDEE